MIKNTCTTYKLIKVLQILFLNIKREIREHLKKHSLPLVFCLSFDEPNLYELFVSRVVNYTAVTLTGVIFFDLGESHDQCSVIDFRN